MSGARPVLRRRLQPWTGLIIAPLVWIILQQGLGTLVYHACVHGGPPWGPILGAMATLICAAAAVTSWRAATDGTLASFIGRVTAGLAAALGLACLLITLSTALVPACAR